MPASKQTRRKMASGARYEGLHATSPGGSHSTHAQTLMVCSLLCAQEYDEMGLAGMKPAK